MTVGVGRKSPCHEQNSEIELKDNSASIPKNATVTGKPGGRLKEEQGACSVVLLSG